MKPDHKALRALAEAAKALSYDVWPSPIEQSQYSVSLEKFHEKANPAAILSLLDEIAELKRLANTYLNAVAYDVKNGGISTGTTEARLDLRKAIND